MKIFWIIVRKFPHPHLMETNRKGIMAAYCNKDCKLSVWILHLDIAIDEPAKNRCICNKFRKRFV